MTNDPKVIVLREKLDRKISKCSCGTFFIGRDCPACGSIPREYVRFEEGDCVKCGALCSIHAYCCTAPMPLTDRDHDSWCR
jgi:hypothetical protein